MKRTIKNSENPLSRRRFFTQAGLGVAAIAGTPVFVSSCSPSERVQRGITRYFSRGDVVLFQGDSITDAGRNKKRQLPNDAASMGTGYVNLIASRLATEFDASRVPLQEAFNGALASAPATYWSGDGVHPSMPGCQLMAETWLKALSW